MKSRSLWGRLGPALFHLLLPAHLLAGYPVHPRAVGTAGSGDGPCLADACLGANPAGLAFEAEERALFVGSLDERGRPRLVGAALLAPAPGLGLGFYAGIGEQGFIELRDPDGARRGGIGQREHRLGAMLGKDLGLGLQTGLGLRGVLSQGQASQGRLEADLGAGIGGSRGWRGGLFLRDLEGLSRPEGAGSLHWGLAGPVPLPGVALGIGFAWQRQAQPQVHAGLEAGLPAGLALRAGTEHRFVESISGEQAGLSLGLGWTSGAWGLDYGMRSAFERQASHHLGVWLGLDVLRRRGRPEAKVEPPTPPPAEAPKEGPEPIPSWGKADPDLRVRKDPLASARALEAAGRLVEALAEYERVSLEHPDLAGAWRGLGDVAYQLKDKPRAIRAYRRLLDLEPDAELSAWLKAYQEEGEGP